MKVESRKLVQAKDIPDGTLFEYEDDNYIVVNRDKNSYLSEHNDDILLVFDPTNGKVLAFGENTWVKPYPEAKIVKG